MLLDIAEVILKLGLPVAALSYLLLRWAFDAGHLTPEAGREEYRAQMRAVRRSVRKGDKRQVNFLQRKWLKFGGGFYGVAALWTYAVVEIREVIAFIGGYEGLDKFLDADFGELLINFVINSLTNFIVAVTWMVYWSNGPGRPDIVLWMVVAIAGFAIGRSLARRGRGPTQTAAPEGPVPEE